MKNPNLFPTGNGFGFLLYIKDITYRACAPGFACRRLVVSSASMKLSIVFAKCLTFV